MFFFFSLQFIKIYKIFTPSTDHKTFLNDTHFSAFLHTTVKVSIEQRADTGTTTAT
jgi:hypothetical protein